MRTERQSMGRVALPEARERIEDLRRERAATEAAAAGAVLDFEIGWLYEEIGQLREAAESYLKGLNAMAAFRPNLSALVRIAEQTSADPRSLYEASIRHGQQESVRASGRVDIAYLALVKEQLDQALLRALVLSSQEVETSSQDAADIGLALELIALRMGEEALSKLGRDLQIGTDDLSTLRPFLLEERLWASLRENVAERSHFERTEQDVEAALSSLDKTNEGRRTALLELAAQAARQAGQPRKEADWLKTLAEFVLQLERSDPNEIDVYSAIAQQQSQTPKALAAALYFEAGDARRRSGDHNASLELLRTAHVLATESSELDRMIITESLMLAAERSGELSEAGTIARSLLELDVPSSREQILWLRLSALERARGELEAAILATGHALKTHSESIAARAVLLGHLAHAERDSDRVDALESWARHQSGETRSLLFWQAAHVASSSTPPRTVAFTKNLFEAAIAAADDPLEILRAYSDWSDNRRDHVEALLRLSEDPLERAALKHERWTRDQERLESDHETALRELLEDSDCQQWAPAVVCYQAARLQEFEILAEAHQLAARNAPTDIRVAHTLAAARAHIRDGKTALAKPLLNEVVGLDERNLYGTALLAAVLRSEGHDTERVALLARIASKEDERSAAQRKTHEAAGEAERHGLADSAARAYRAFLQRYPDTPTVAWCLLRLADRSQNVLWREQALETLASHERQTGIAGYGTLRWIEHLALLPRRTTAQEGALASALSFAGTQTMLAATADVWTSILQTAHQDEHKRRDRIAGELLSLASSENGWRETELRSGALRFMMLSADAHDDALLLAHGQYEDQPSIQTALSNLEAMPWTAPASLGVRWEEVVDHWHAGLLTLHDQTPEFVETSVMARWHLHCEELDKALELAERAVSDDPDDLASWVVLRNAALGLQNWETFVQANEIVAEPLDATGRAELKSLSGYACTFGLGDSARGSSYFLEALELDPLNDDAFGWVQQHLRGRQRNRLVAPLAARIEKTDDPRELLELHLDLAMAHQAGSEFREAAVVLERALLLDENNEHLLAGVAETWIHLEEWERAQAALVTLANIAKQTDTYDACVFSAADILHGRMNESERAIALLESTYETIAAKLPALELLATMLEEQERFADAARYVQEAIARTARGERHPWLLRLGRLEERAGRLESARETYREALDAAPGASLAFESLLRCEVPSEERRIRARQLVSALRERLDEPHSVDLKELAADLQRAAQWNENIVLARCSRQVVDSLSEQSAAGEVPKIAQRAYAAGPYLAVVPHIRLRAETPLDRAAHRLQDLLLSILEHSLEAYGHVKQLEPTDPVAENLGRAGAAFGFENAPAYRASQGDDALGLVLGADRKPAWVVGPNFQLVDGELPLSKAFIVGQLASAYALGVLPFVIREQATAVGIWNSLSVAMTRSPLKRGEQRFEETLRARVPKHLQRELGPQLLKTTNKQCHLWCEEAYELVLRAGACFCGELATPLRAVEQRSASSSARDRLLRFWLTADAEAAVRFFWSPA